MLRSLAIALATLVPAGSALAAPGPVPTGELPAIPPGAGEPGGSGLALRAAKILTVPPEGPQVIDNGVLLVRDGKIEAVGPARQVEVPEGYALRDMGEHWLMPGMIELHNHIGTGLGLFINDINDTVYLTNPGLRASAGVRPDNGLMQRGVAGGVTSALFIPGSGSNMGGWGVLLKLGHGTYELAEIRNPGSLKVAQAGNPESFTVGVGRSFMNWNTRNTIRRGLAYAKKWEAHERGQAPKPEKDIQLEIFRHLYKKETQLSVHTQVYQVVLMTCTMMGGEMNLDAYIDHGSFDGFKAAPEAVRHGVDAILGPRMVTPPVPPFIDTDGAILGMAAEYQKRGHDRVGFNTDCVDNGRFITPPQEELPLQAGLAMRYGFDGSHAEGVRGLTIVPAMAAGIDHRVGSLEPGKDADIVVISGDPGDPRQTVEKVLTDGKVVYDTAVETRRW